MTTSSVNTMLPASTSETLEFEITRYGLAAVVDDVRLTEVGVNSDLLGLLLNQQKHLSAIEMFSYLYDEPCLLPVSQERYYKNLLPVQKPGVNQQYAFQVDLDRCSGCKACVAACHTLNGLDETETWRDVGVLHKVDKEDSFLQHITSACHHCVDPACMKGCPTNAYEKDLNTGIVYHLDDQCFGCQYCTLACPYGVPKYHSAKGIVRKCDMCRHRLEVNEAPACVQACPHEAITITVVDVTSVDQENSETGFLPRTHDPSFTRPTTRYRSKSILPQFLMAGDETDIRPEHAHLPLIVMLVLMQVSLGGYFAAAMFQLRGGMVSNRSLFVLSAVSFLLGQIGLVAATLHLGRPIYAFRGVLGIRHSWLSREAVAFGGFAGCSAVATLASGVQARFSIVENTLPGLSSMLPGGAVMVSLLGTITIGAIGTYCSVMVYVFTQRAYWNFRRTNLRFFGTVVIAGLAIMLGVLACDALPNEVAIRTISAGLCFAMSLKLTGELVILHSHSNFEMADDWKTSRLLMGELRSTLIARLACGGVGGLMFPMMLMVGVGSVASLIVGVLAFVGCLITLTGELFERTLFFQAVIAPKMPGGLR